MTFSHHISFDLWHLLSFLLVMLYVKCLSIFVFLMFLSCSDWSYGFLEWQFQRRNQILSGIHVIHMTSLGLWTLSYLPGISTGELPFSTFHSLFFVQSHQVLSTLGGIKPLRKAVFEIWNLKFFCKGLSFFLPFVEIKQHSAKQPMEWQIKRAIN